MGTAIEVMSKIRFNTKNIIPVELCENRFGLQ